MGVHRAEWWMWVCTQQWSNLRPYMQEWSYQRVHYTVTFRCLIPYRCDCPKTLSGSECHQKATKESLQTYGQSTVKEAKDPLPCLNDCNGRGTCVYGACVCTRGERCCARG